MLYENECLHAGHKPCLAALLQFATNFHMQHQLLPMYVHMQLAAEGAVYKQNKQKPRAYPGTTTSKMHGIPIVQPCAGAVCGKLVLNPRLRSQELHLCATG